MPTDEQGYATHLGMSKNNNAQAAIQEARELGLITKSPAGESLIQLSELPLGGLPSIQVTTGESKKEITEA